MTDAPTELRVGYNPAFGAVFMVLAVVQVALGSITGNALTIGLGLFFVIIAALYLTMPYFVLVDGAVQLRNLLGMTMRQYPFGDRSELEVGPEGRTITLVRADGARVKIKVARWLARRADWERFVAALSARAFD